MLWRLMSNLSFMSASARKMRTDLKNINYKIYLLPAPALVSTPTNRKLNLFTIEGWPIAGKTGTSQSFRDAWFIGYSAELLGGIWTGNDDDTPRADVTGGGLPARLWSDMMRVAHEGRSPSLLRGADQLIQLTEEQQARVGYYRDLGMAFSGLAGTEG